MAKERNESGQYVEKATLDDVLAAFDTVEGPPVVTSADIAEATDLSRDSARRKLERLRDQGRVARRKTAGRSLYWPVDHDRDRPARGEGRASGQAGATNPSPGDARPSDRPDESGPGERREAARGAPDDQHPTDTSGGDSAAHSADVATVVEDVAGGWEDPPERLEARKAAARAVLQHALDTGDAVGKSEAIDLFHDTHPVEGQNAETWWRKNVRPVLRAVGNYSNGAHGYVVDDLNRSK